jgi:hypothetical protein
MYIDVVSVTLQAIFLVPGTNLLNRLTLVTHANGLSSNTVSGRSGGAIAPYGQNMLAKLPPPTWSLLCVNLAMALHQQLHLLNGYFVQG